MAVGDTVTINGVEFEVVWSGGEGLIPDRQTKVPAGWTPPPRIYNRTGKHAKKAEEVEVKIIDVLEED